MQSERAVYLADMHVMIDMAELSIQVARTGSSLPASVGRRDEITEHAQLRVRTGIGMVSRRVDSYGLIIALKLPPHYS